MAQHIYNLKKQIPDARDYQVKDLLAAVAPVTIPASFLLTNDPAIYNQGNLGSCTANAGAAARIMLTNLTKDMARMFLYWEERNIEGTVSTDAGAQMRDIGNALATYGICEANYDPYNISQFTNPPTAKAVANALKYKIKSYHSVSDVAEIKQTIATLKQPVLVGIDVYDSFESDAVALNGIVPMPNVQTEQMLGGHAVLAIGYDDSKQWVMMRNSWGKNWGATINGKRGYFYLPYAYFTSGYAYDFWVLQN
jgi:C1A family cysteine protease